MFIIVIYTTGVICVTMAVVIAVIRAKGKLCLLFDIPSFLKSVLNGLAVFIQDELGKPRLKV